MAILKMQVLEVLSAEVGKKGVNMGAGKNKISLYTHPLPKNQMRRKRTYFSGTPGILPEDYT